MIEDGILLAARTYPLAVQICANDRATIVTYDYAVRIQHGYNFENEGVSQEICFLIIAD
jgi:hypothetical protein